MGAADYQPFQPPYSVVGERVGGGDKPSAIAAIKSSGGEGVGLMGRVIYHQPLIYQQPCSVELVRRCHHSSTTFKCQTPCLGLGG